MNKPDTEPATYLVLDYNADNPYWNAGSAERASGETYEVAPQAGHEINHAHQQIPWHVRQYSQIGLQNDRMASIGAAWSAPANTSLQNRVVGHDYVEPVWKDCTNSQAAHQEKHKGERSVDFVGLDLSGQAINNLSKEIFNYTFLTILRLDGNNLVNLPREIGFMKNLVTLDVSKNKLQSIPAEIGQLISLRELLLHKNQLRTLPHELGQLYLLNRLVIDENPFDEPLLSIFCEGGSPAIMHYLCEMCPVGPPPPDREWVSITDCRSADAAGFPFTIMSYNVLCKNYASKSHYGYAPTWVLNWDYRKDLIIREILSCAPDIICLQEVEFDKYESFFHAQLSSLGSYKGFFWPKTRARTMNEYERSQVDGCAIFWKTSVFRSLVTHCIELQQVSLQDSSLRKVKDMLSRLTNRDNVAVLTLLEHIDTEMKILIVNAHLHWDPTLTDVKLAQMFLLTNEIQRLLISWGCCYSAADVKRFPVILAGDLNSTPDSSVFGYIDSGSTPKDHPDLADFSYRTPLLESFRHQFDFKSVYSLYGELDFTNLTPCFKGVIDYIWYSSRSLIPLGVLNGIDSSYTKKVIGFPNAHNPSDHIFLLSSFAFRNQKPQYR